MKERLPVERREILSIPLRKGEKEGVDEWPQTQKKCSANHSVSTRQSVSDDSKIKVGSIDSRHDEDEVQTKEGR